VTAKDTFRRYHQKRESNGKEQRRIEETVEDL
jgi:hypothetical protein